MFAVFVLLFLGLIQTGSSEFGCRDEDNNLVDWFYLYKLPEKATGHSANSGLRYMFITANGSRKWQLSEHNVNESSSIPGRTLEPVLLAPRESSLTLLYNDEPPEGKTDGLRGHTKGVVATDATSGFWLIHSVPKYPPELGHSYHYPATGQKYGQSFLCISFAADQMNSIGTQVALNEAHVYSFAIPTALADIFPKLVEATKMKLNKEPPYWNAVELKSQAGIPFHSFAKNRFFKKELYADLIAPALEAALLVESWQHGSGNLPSNCSVHDWSVLNVKKVQLDENYHFETLQDHSKWAVTESGATVCVGDINRQEHQKVRGGGSVCSGLEDVAAAYKRSVELTEVCPRS